MVVPLFVIGCLEGLDWEGGGREGGTNVSCQLKFCPFVSCQSNTRLLVSCQLNDY